jgi:intracellular sulfur oxidation DsrE/DsrF family protein
MTAMQRTLARLAACATLIFPPASIAADSAAQAKERVVIQVSDNDPKKWHLALNNARNVQVDLGADRTEIEIVAYGPGIGMLKADAEVANRIEDAVAAGVKVVACENTMRAQKLSRDDMNGKIGYVMAGVVQIMRRQQQGWAYLRP